MAKIHQTAGFPGFNPYDLPIVLCLGSIMEAAR
jgi:hypothetical protein